MSRWCHYQTNPFNVLVDVHLHIYSVLHLSRYVSPISNGVARIFFGGGPPGTFSSPIREPTAFSGGGGVVAEIFRDLNYRIGFSGGGGVVAEIFRDLNYRVGFSGGGGGVVADIFPVNGSITFPRFLDIVGTFSGHLRIIRRLWTLAGIQAHFPCLLTHSSHVTTSIHSGKKNLPKVWGGHGPPGPPPGYATAYLLQLKTLCC